MSDKFTFNFSRFFANLRRVIRSLGTESQWYIQLRIFLIIMDDRAVRASWTYDQIWLETATDSGLDTWGTRYKIPRVAGETDPKYRERLIIERAFRSGKANLQSKRKRLIQYIGDIEPEDLSIQSVYNIEFGKTSFYMGGPIDQHNLTRKYILYRYWISLPELPENHDRSKLVNLIGQLNIGGNIPEFREEHGEIDWYTMGGKIGAIIGSRRSEQSKNILIY